jgi:hypothetical protein
MLDGIRILEKRVQRDVLQDQGVKPGKHVVDLRLDVLPGPLQFFKYFLVDLEKAQAIFNKLGIRHEVSLDLDGGNRSILTQAHGTPLPCASESYTPLVVPDFDVFSTGLVETVWLT